MDETWIKWAGGECPVDEYDFVEVRFRNGFAPKGTAARWWQWDCINDPCDIVAYRVVSL